MEGDVSSTLVRVVQICGIASEIFEPASADLRSNQATFIMKSGNHTVESPQPRQQEILGIQKGLTLLGYPLILGVTERLFNL